MTKYSDIVENREKFGEMQEIGSLAPKSGDLASLQCIPLYKKKKA